MCAIIGVYCQSKIDDLDFIIKRLFEESQIRGKHATGYSIVSGDKIKTFIEPKPAKDFINKHFFSDKEVKLIGHCRYSTSDIEYNQPIFNDHISIVHNGVITQSSPDKWKELYGYRCQGKNDSELILQSYRHGDNPLEVFENSSMAVIALSPYSFIFYRNGSRPLWYCHYKGGTFVSSTRDILKRVFGNDMITEKCHCGSEYFIDETGEVVCTNEPIKLNDLQVNLQCSNYYNIIH